MNAETRYIIACYGLLADSPMRTVYKGEHTARVFTRELDAMLADGWTCERLN
jgi:hypothetical protein